FFQAEDGIRDKLVTGVQTCALPISHSEGYGRNDPPGHPRAAVRSAVGGEVDRWGRAIVSGPRVLQIYPASSAAPIPEAVRVDDKIGRASCRETGRGQVVGAVVEGI